MKHVLVVLTALATMACGDTVINNIFEIFGPSPITASPSSSASDDEAVCPPARHVQIAGPSLLDVGDTVELDATPLDAQRQPRSPECDESEGIAWEDAGPCTLDVSQARPFNPVLTAQATGICAVEARVPGTAAVGRATVTVQ